MTQTLEKKIFKKYNQVCRRKKIFETNKNLGLKVHAPKMLVNLSLMIVQGKIKHMKAITTSTSMLSKT